jgi:hypothetical protein
MSSDVTMAVRIQARRQAEARALLARPDVHLVLLPGARVRVEVGPADAVIATQRLRAELAELLADLRCLRCGEPLDERTRVPAEVGFVHKWTCSGPARRPKASA